MAWGRPGDPDSPAARRSRRYRERKAAGRVVLQLTLAAEDLARIASAESPSPDDLAVIVAALKQLARHA